MAHSAWNGFHPIRPFRSDRIVNAREISERLASQAADVAAHLLPRGKRAGQEWKAGSVTGDSGQSLSVRIAGSKRGVWKDFATGEGGDMLDLWAARFGVSVSEAMRDAAAYLGVQVAAPLKPQKQFTRPAKPAATQPRSAVRSWLHSRGLTDDTIAAFKLAGTPSDDAVILPYLRDGELVNTKTRSLSEKKMWQAKDAEPCLFGWHLIDPRARSVCITEGEIDAMTLHQIGVAALSCNQGAGNHQWIDSDFERLNRFSEIIVCYDDDDAGRKGAREVANRLGLDRCKLARFHGYKDANELLIAGGSREDFAEAIKDARPVDPDELVSASIFVDEVIADLYQVDGEALDPALFITHEHSFFRFRPGEISVWTGFNGHGKSQLLGQVILGLLRHDERALIFSGEMVPRRIMSRMTRQAAGTGEPTVQYIRDIAEWFKSRLWIYQHVGQVNSQRLFEVFAYGAKRYGIKHFVIDSLMMLEDVPEEGKGAFEAQRAFMIRAAAFAKQYGAHVNIVAHPRKAQDERQGPGKLDVSGSAKITNLADNVFSVWARLREEGEESNGEPDGKLELLKQRNGEAQHVKLWLWFDAKSLQYTCIRHKRAMQYMTAEEREFAQ